MPGVTPSIFVVEAGTPDAPKITYIEGARFPVYLDGDRGSFLVPVPGNQVALSVANDFCTTQLGYSDEAGPAVVAFEGKLTDADLKQPKYQSVLKHAIERQNNWYKLLVAMADDDWTRHRRHLTISNLQRRAAQALGLEREWLFLTEDVSQDKKSLCPACYAIIVPGAAICQTCGCHVDPEAAKKFVFAK